MDGWIRLDATKELPKKKEGCARSGAIVSIGRVSRFASGLHLSCLFFYFQKSHLINIALIN